MIVIIITEKESKRLLSYIQYASSQKRLGFEEFTTTEQLLLKRKVENNKGSIELSVLKTKLLLEYIYDYTSNGFATTVEDDIILQKLYQAIINHYNLVMTDYQRKIKEIDILKSSFESSFPKSIIEHKSTEVFVAVNPPDDSVRRVEVSKNKKNSHIYSRSQKEIDTSVDSLQLAEKLKKASDRIIESHEKKDEKEIVKEIIKKTKGKGLF